MKVCSKCHISKPTDQFHKETKGGLRSQCKTCRNDQASRWRKRNRDHINKYTRQWKRENPDKVYASHRKYVENNREKRRAYEKRYRDKNRQRIRDQAFLRYHKNPYPPRESARKYRRNKETHQGPRRIYRGEISWVERDFTIEKHERELDKIIARMDWEIVSSHLPEDLLIHCRRFLSGEEEMSSDVIEKIREHI